MGMKRTLGITALILIIFIPVTIWMIKFSGWNVPPTYYDGYAHITDHWSLVHLGAGFILSGTLWLFKIPHRWNLPITAIVGSLFEVWEHFYAVHLATDGGIEGWPNVVVDILLVALGGMFWIALAYDPGDE